MPSLKTYTCFKVFTPLGLLLLLAACRQKAAEQVEWSVYRGDKASSGYSSLRQINKSNLSKLGMRERVTAPPSSATHLL